MNNKMKRDLFWEIRFLKENGVHKSSALKPLYDNKVKMLRDANKESDYYGLDNQIVVKNDWDRAIIRFPIGQYPDRQTAEDFAENFRIHCMPSQYDCTGQLFTAWQSVHYLNGEWWCWQCNCLDV